jgi:hypothetical protein
LEAVVTSETANAIRATLEMVLRIGETLTGIGRGETVGSIQGITVFPLVEGGHALPLRYETFAMLVSQATGIWTEDLGEVREMDLLGRAGGFRILLFEVAIFAVEAAAIVIAVEEEVAPWMSAICSGGVADPGSPGETAIGTDLTGETTTDGQSGMKENGHFSSARSPGRSTIRR